LIGSGDAPAGPARSPTGHGKPGSARRSAQGDYIGSGSRNPAQIEGADPDYRFPKIPDPAPQEKSFDPGERGVRTEARLLFHASRQ